MKLGATTPCVVGDRGDLDRVAWPRHRAWHRRVAQGPDHRDLRAGKLGQDDADACMWLPRNRRRAASAPSSTPSMRSTRNTRKKLGVDLDELLISQPDTGEQALEITDTLVRSGAVCLVVDSVAALTPRAELEGDMGDSLGGRAGPPDEPGDAQAHRLDLQVELHGDLHQPDPHEDRRDVRQPGDHHRRQRAEILRLRAARYPPHRRDQGPRRGRGQRRPA
jgi:hypothetical protein